MASSFLGSAESFAVLAGGAVTCTNAAVTGDVGAGTVVTQTRRFGVQRNHELELCKFGRVPLGPPPKLQKAAGLWRSRPRSGLAGPSAS
jgi:hypothetical protein